MAEARQLIGGTDYPRTWQEFSDRFATEAACREYLTELRWPEGFRCPACGGDRAWLTGRGYWKCSSCARQTSVTAGTIFQDTRTPLRTWFAATWYVTNQKQGVSTLGLQRVLGLGSYETAWAWLHKLRRAMVRPGRDRLAGEVEVDESYVGGVELGAIGRLALDKAIVVIAAERRGGRAIGRVRMAQVLDVSRETLVPFVKAVVEPGATVITDAWRGYSRVSREGYQHRVINLSAEPEPAHVLMPAVHRAASLLQRWVLGTHQGGVRLQHLDYYLDEFTFRFNRRRSRHRGLLFRRLLEQAVATPPTITDDLIGDNDLFKF